MGAGQITAKREWRAQNREKRGDSGRKRERRKLVWTYWELNGENVDRDDQQHGDEGDRCDDPEVV
jgi:hypothetical protein